MVQVAITNHPMSAAHKVVKVESRGRIYAVTYAEPWPTEADVRELWRIERKAFRPYNESTNRYLA